MNTLLKRRDKSTTSKVFCHHLLQNFSPERGVLRMGCACGFNAHHICSSSGLRSGRPGFDFQDTMHTWARVLFAAEKSSIYSEPLSGRDWTKLNFMKNASRDNKEVHHLTVTKSLIVSWLARCLTECGTEERWTGRSQDRRGRRKAEVLYSKLQGWGLVTCCTRPFLELDQA